MRNRLNRFSSAAMPVLALCLAILGQIPTAMAVLAAFFAGNLVFFGGSTCFRKLAAVEPDVTRVRGGLTCQALFSVLLAICGGTWAYMAGKIEYVWLFGAALGCFVTSLHVEWMFCASDSFSGGLARALAAVLTGFVILLNISLPNVLASMEARVCLGTWLGALLTAILAVGTCGLPLGKPNFAWLRHIPAALPENALYPAVCALLYFRGASRMDAIGCCAGAGLLEVCRVTFRRDRMETPAMLLPVNLICSVFAACTAFFPELFGKIAFYPCAAALIAAILYARFSLPVIGASVGMLASAATLSPYLNISKWYLLAATALCVACTLFLLPDALREIRARAHRRKMRG